MPEYGKVDSEWFSRVMWSDESRFQLHADASERCVQRSGEKYNSECISTTVKHGENVSGCEEPFQLLVLVSCFTRCENSINALEYRRILEKDLLPTIEKLFSEEMSFFQQDNAPTHIAKITNKSIRLMFWPGQSPDLNPIENIWSHIKPQVYSQGLNI